MTVPRVLLLTGTPPGYSGVGGIFLKELCMSYPKDSICCCTLPRTRSNANDLDWLPIEYFVRPRERGFELLGHFGQVSVLFVQQYMMLTRNPALVRHITRFGRQYDTEIVWSILNSPALIHLAHKVAATLSVPLVVTVWDPPERFAVDLRMDAFSKRLLLREFAKTLRAADRCAVASEEMHEEYKKRYGIESVVLIHGVHPKLHRPATKQLAKSDQFIIGVAGSLYAQPEFKALISALSSVGWRLVGRDVIVRVLGSVIPIHTSSLDKVHIEYFGWRTLEETIDILSKVHITYLPYWFDKRYSMAVRLCFPNKLSTYLAAGKPVLFHGPEDSSPAHFFGKYPVGLCCHSLEKGPIIESLKRFITDAELYTLAAKAGQEALDKELNLNVFRQRFAALIGIKDDELLPLD